MPRLSARARRAHAPLGDHVLDLVLHTAEDGVHRLPPAASLDPEVLQTPPQIICRTAVLNKQDLGLQNTFAIKIRGLEPVWLTP